MIKYLENENEFALLISNGFTIVDFYADWCGPCKMISPILEELGVDVIKVNVNLFNQLATKYGVMSIPTLLFVKNGEVVKKEIGFRSKVELEEIISNLKIDS